MLIYKHVLSSFHPFELTLIILKLLSLSSESSLIKPSSFKLFSLIELSLLDSLFKATRELFALQNFLLRVSLFLLNKNI